MTADDVQTAVPTVEVDGGKCCGYGNCVLVAPDLFDLSPDTNLAFVVDGAPVAAHRDLLVAAAKQCPTDAITVRG